MICKNASVSLRQGLLRFRYLMTDVELVVVCVLAGEFDVQVYYFYFFLLHPLAYNYEFRFNCSTVDCLIIHFDTTIKKTMTIKNPA